MLPEAYEKTQNQYAHLSVPVDPAYDSASLIAPVHRIIPWTWTCSFVFTKITLYSYIIDDYLRFLEIPFIYFLMTFNIFRSAPIFISTIYTPLVSPVMGSFTCCAPPAGITCFSSNTVPERFKRVITTF